MRHQADLGQRSTSPIFAEPFGDPSPVCRLVFVHAAGGGFLAVIHDMLGCRFLNYAFSTDGAYCAPYFIQPVLELRVVATSQMTNHHLLIL